MPTSDRPAGPVLALYAGTLCLSAFLLFSVQPMFARMVLPKLGGAPSVWAVAMCFFQAALLAGYAYAHIVGRIINPRIAVLLHLAVLAAAMLALPIRIPAAIGDPPPGDAYRWQLAVMTLGVGLPFLAIAATAPLLQAWFARSGHPHAKDPYFLYGASNIGSLAALLLYPVAIEPRLGILGQSRWWGVGFVLLFALIWACARRMLDTEERLGAISDTETSPSEGILEGAVSWTRRARWVFLAFVPSALIIAVTNHLTTDIASAPFLWVIPLALFLLTFIVVFRDPPLVPHKLMLALHPFAVAASLGILRTDWDNRLLIGSGVVLIGFLIIALVCHRELYLARPAARRLTEFYLWMSFGGVLGGIFSALVAPQIFSKVTEFPLIVLLSLACRPDLLRRLRGLATWLPSMATLAAGAALLTLSAWLLTKYAWPWSVAAGSVALGVIALGVCASLFLPRFEPGLLVLMPLSFLMIPPIELEGLHQRSFFGVYRIVEAGGGDFRLLQHGTTVHGAERIRDVGGRPAEGGHAISYYYPQSPMARGVALARELKGGEGHPINAGVVGLGTGSMGCHAETGDHWRFFEIDPLIVKIASNPAYFRMLSTCQPEPDIVLGDARLTLAKIPDGSLDYLVIDAFSSDAIPVHLMTLEAVQLYLSKLSDKGLLALHVSNRHLDLVTVASDILSKLTGVSAVYVDDEEADGSYDQMKSDVVFMAKDASVLESMLTWEKGETLAPTKGRPWTDDYSGIFEAFWRRLHPPVAKPSGEAETKAD